MPNKVNYISDDTTTTMARNFLLVLHLVHLVRRCTFGAFWYAALRSVRYRTSLYVFGVFKYLQVRFSAFNYVGMPRRFFWYEVMPRGGLAVLCAIFVLAFP
jgi:hypothetical protein